MTDLNRESNINIVSITGHRTLDHDADLLKSVVKDKLYQLETDVVIVGMAVGFDMLVAEVCADEAIPFVAAIPFIGQTRLWPNKEKERYRKLIDKAWKYKLISKGGYVPWKLHARNKWMIDRGTIVLSYWNGEPKGGTYSAVKLARAAGLPCENLYHLCSNQNTE